MIEPDGLASHLYTFFASSDHAVAMAKFANDIMRKVHALTRKLERSLGPDTGDLALRAGLHSGPGKSTRNNLQVRKIHSDQLTLLPFAQLPLVFYAGNALDFSCVSTNVIVCSFLKYFWFAAIVL
jgi:hypothetical protein